jgi:hypothetical protein
MSIVNVTGVGPVNFPEGMSDRDIIRAIEFDILPNIRPAAPVQAAPPPSTSGSSLLRGIDELQGSVYSAIEGGGNITGIGALQRFGREGRIRNEQEAQQSLPDSQRMTFEQAQGVGQNVRAAGQALGMSLPSMAPGLAGAATGAALGSVVPGIGTAVGGVLGGAAASLPLFFGTNRQRQLQANPDQPVNEGRAALTAIPQALSEGVVDRVSLGLGRVLGIGADVVARNVIPRILRGIGVGAATEVPTEVFQQVLERAQAGLDILGDEAMAEYREAAIASAVVGGGIGGGFAALPGGTPPAGPRTREEDEALRGAIDTVTGERNYLDETRKYFDEVALQVEARNRANRFPDIRNVDPEIYAAESPVIAANMAAELIDIRDRNVRSNGELGLPGLVEEAKAVRSDLAVAEQAASAAGVAPQDDPAYQSAKARYDDLNGQISNAQSRIAYLSSRVDPRIAAAGPIAELTQAQQNLKSLLDAQKEANKRLEKAKKSFPVNLGNLESIQAERADLFKKVQDQQREILKLQRLIPEDQRQITARENKKGFARPAFEIAGAKGERRKADAEATDLRVGAAPFANDRLVVNPEYDDEGRLSNGEVATRLDPPNPDGSVVAYVNRLINGQEQEVAVPTNVNDILRIPVRNAGVSERETDRTKQAPSARLTQEAVGAAFGPEQILGPFIGPAVDPNQMDLNPRRVTDRVGGQNTGTASPEPDYVAPRPPAPAPKAAAPAAPSSQGILPQDGGQQQVPPTIAPGEQVASFNVPEGKEFTVITPDGSMRVNVVPEVVDLFSLVPASGDFQNRNVNAKPNQSTINAIANSPDFFQLTTSPYADRGAPIIGPDDMIEVGNHRVMGLKLATQVNPDGFARYVSDLSNAGYDTKGMQFPVLVRRRVTELTDDQRVDFARLANKDPSQSFSALETAKEDASKITPELMAKFDGEVTGGIRAAKNMPFVRSFLSSLLTRNELNKSITAEGNISDELETRIKNALFAHAYKNPQLLAKVVERGDDDSKTITNGLIGATGAMQELRRGIETGLIRPEFDIVDAIVAASDRLRAAKANGIEMSRVLDTEDMMNPLSDLDKVATLLLLNDNKDKIASASAITKRLKAYAEDAKTQTPDKDLVGGERRITPEEALTKALTPGQTSMFSSRNAPGGQDVEAEAESRERKAPPEVERALALIKARLDSLRAKGSQGAALAKALEDALANRKLDANQIYAAFMVDNAILKSMPKGANYEFQFLHDIVLSDKDVAEKAGVKLGTKLQGVKVAPARDGLPGLIKLSLAEDMLPILNETALHEAFHVLQDYFAAYDKGYKAAIDKHFKNDMKVADFEPSIKRRLQALKPPGSEQSYWDLLVEAFKDKNEQDTKIKHGYEAQAYAFGALADAAMRGEKVVGLLPPFQRFLNFVRDTMAALRSGFTGDGFRTPASLLGRAGERAAKYDQQAPRTASQSFSARNPLEAATLQRNVNPSSLIFREQVQHRLDEVADRFPEKGGYPPIVVAKTGNGFLILDGHNRAKIAYQRDEKIDAVVVPESVYRQALSIGLDEVDVSHAALERAGQSDAASAIRQQFRGINWEKSEADAQKIFDEYEDSSSLKDEGEQQFSARKAPPKPATTSTQTGSPNAAGNAQAFYNSVVKRVDTPNVFDSVLAYMFDKKPGEKISAAIARTSVNAAAPLHAFAAMASKNGYTGLSAGRALELQMSNSGRINQILNAGMGKLNARTGEITLRTDVKPLLQIMGEADVGNDATKKGWLQTYLVALRERDLRKVNRRVFTDTEDQTITDTIKNIEAKYPQFKQTAADLDKMNKALIEFALEAGLITKQHASVLSSKFYTPAYREDVDQISNALNVQLGGGVKSINDLYSNIILNADSIMKASLKNLAMRTAAETMKFANVGRENTTGTKSDNTISYRSNGKKVDFDVDDPVLFSALTSMPRETINGIYQAMAGTASFFRDLITVAPSFIFKNLYAGKISASVQEGAPFLANTFGGVRDALKNTTTLQNFQMQTGFGGMEWGMKPKDMVKTFERRLTDKGMMEAISRGSVFSALRQGFTKLQALSEASEMAERIKLSEHLIKKGMSPRDAYFQAYMIAPYSRKGTGAGWLGQTVHFMAPLIPFLNAKIQTTYRLFENEKGSKTILKVPQEIFLRGLVLTAFSTAVYALNLADDEEEWDGRPNYMKLNYDIIPFTSGLVTLPRAYEIGKIFGGLPVFALDAIRRGEGRDLTEALIQVAVSTAWVTPIPKAMEPIIGAVTNYDFFRKQPYESAGEQGLPIQERVRRSTTSIAKGVSAGFNSVFGDSLSPIQAQAVLEGYTGTIGTMIMAGFDSLLSAAGAIPSKPAGAFGDPLSMPAIIASTVGLNTFYRDPDSMTSRFVNDFYRIKEMTDQLVRSQTLATNARDYERLQELRGEEGLPLRMRPAVNAASTRIANLNKRIRLIEGGRLGSIEKTEAIQPLIAQRDRIARRVVDQARNLGVL